MAYIVMASIQLWPLYSYGGGSLGPEGALPRMRREVGGGLDDGPHEHGRRKGLEELYRYGPI